MQVEYTKLFVFLGVSILLALTLLLISVMMNQYKENLLKLFGSFLPETIQKYIDSIEKSIASIEISHLKLTGGYDES